MWMDEAGLFTSLLLLWFCLQSQAMRAERGNYYDLLSVKREDLSLVAPVKL